MATQPATVPNRAGSVNGIWALFGRFVAHLTQLGNESFHVVFSRRYRLWNDVKLKQPKDAPRAAC
jgi:hypothetical protein